MPEKYVCLLCKKAIDPGSEDWVEVKDSFPAIVVATPVVHPGCYKEWEAETQTSLRSLAKSLSSA